MIGQHVKGGVMQISRVQGIQMNTRHRLKISREYHDENFGNTLLRLDT